MMIPKMLMMEPSYQQGLTAMIRNLDGRESVTDAMTIASSQGVRILVIPVHGYLAHRSHAHWDGRFTGYGFISSLVRKAMTDESIDAAVFDINSGGGMVDGAFEVSDEIEELTKIKPTASIVDAHCYSAAYALACKTGTIYIPETGGVGSIGVISSHTSLKKMYDDIGIDETLVFSGDHKADGNMYEKLPEKVKQSMQESNDEVRLIFAEHVSKGRNISVQKVIDTQAALYSSTRAIEAELADVVTSPSDAYQMFIEKVKLIKDTDGGVIMSSTPATPVVANAPATPATPVVANAPATPATPVVANATVIPVVATAQTERARIKGIIECAEASGRNGLASHLAYNTDMSVVDAQAALSASEKSGGASPFIAAMESSGQPNIDASDGESDEMSASARIIADFQSVTGIKGTL